MQKSHLTLSLVTLLLFVGCQKDAPLGDNDNTDPITNDLFLPQINITTNGEIVDEPKVSGNIQLIENGAILEEYTIGIEYRGSSSQSFDKKSYGFETWDSNLEDLDVPLAGFPEEEDWILNGPYSDKSLMRNVLIYDLSNAIGRYTSRTKFYELTINDDFLGTYVLMEKLKRDKNRIAIEKNEDGDISGGYVIKIDKPTGDGEWYNESFSFPSQYNPQGGIGGASIHFLYDYPDPDEITIDQKSYIQNYMNDFETVLLSDNFSDPIEGYQKYIDLDSFVDFFLLNEISKNVDGFRLSTYMHKDKGEKLKMGPIWDFNLAFGNADYCGGGETTGWGHRINDICGGDGPWQVPFWWGRLMEDPIFVTSLKARWQFLRSGNFSTQSIMGRIQVIESNLIEKDAINRNFIEWPILGQYIWPNNFVGATYTEESNYLKTWVIDRMSWLDNAIEEL